MAKVKQRGAGGRLSRSEVVTVRLDPRLRYGVELAARKHRRTASSFIEWAVEEALQKIIVREGHEGNEATTVDDALWEVWDVDEPDRFVNLAFKYPELLSHEEQVLWKLIRERGYFWKSRYLQRDDKRVQVWDVRPENLSFKLLRALWEELKKVAAGELSPEDVLPADYNMVSAKGLDEGFES